MRKHRTLLEAAFISDNPVDTLRRMLLSTIEPADVFAMLPSKKTLERMDSGNELKRDARAVRKTRSEWRSSVGWETLFLRFACGGVHIFGFAGGAGKAKDVEKFLVATDGYILAYSRFNEPCAYLWLNLPDLPDIEEGAMDLKMIHQHRVVLPYVRIKVGSFALFMFTQDGKISQTADVGTDFIYIDAKTRHAHVACLTDLVDFMVVLTFGGLLHGVYHRRPFIPEAGVVLHNLSGATDRSKAAATLPK